MTGEVKELLAVVNKCNDADGRADLGPGRQGLRRCKTLQYHSIILDAHGKLIVEFQPTLL